MRYVYSKYFRLPTLVFCHCAMAVAAFGQSAPTPPGEGSSIGFYLVFILVIAAVAGGWYFWQKSKENALRIPQSQYNYNLSYNHAGNDSYHMDGVDAERDLELLRKAKRGGKKREGDDSRGSPETVPTQGGSAFDIYIDTKAFQEKMRKLQYAQLPINSFSQLAPAKNYNQLEILADRSLSTAIEQVNEEYEEDESIREVALRILTQFRSRNSIETISQVALYDLSSSLRSKAVTVLADFDHESVFETILLACADPTREVRAAAARGLFRLNFDRAHAWKRIIEANDEFRMSHAARAAVESGIVAKSFDRLVHEDLKIAYEAFALVSMLIKAGETESIFETIRDHKDERVKFALLHVLKVHKDERTRTKLNDLRIGRSWPADLANKIRETANSLEQTTTWTGREL